MINKKLLLRLIIERNKRKLRNPLKYFKPQSYQIPFWNSVKKLIWILGGNRSGKTINGAAKVVKTMIDTPGGEGWAVTHANMSVPIQQKKIYKLLPKDQLHYCKYSEQLGFSNRVVLLKNGFELRFKTYDQGAASFQGAAKDIIWNDEECPQDVFKEEQARVIDRDGLILNTMTPINGMTWTYSILFENDNMRKLIDYFFWNSFDNKYINQQALKNIIGSYAKKEAEVRSLGSFMNLHSGRLYYAFDRLIHKKKIGVRSDLPLRLSFDFNVNPMTTSICQIVPGNRLLGQQERVLNIIETINTADCNTKKQCRILREKLAGWQGEIIIYGDATNQRRTESADVNTTNWVIVKEYFPNALYKVPAINPVVMERVGWVNAKLINFNGEIGIVINDTGCEGIIRDLEQGTWAKDGRRKEKSNLDLNHNSDNIDYIVSEEFKLTEDAFGIADSLEPGSYEMADSFLIE